MNKFSHKLSLTYIANTMAIMTTIIYRSWGTCARTPRPRQLRNSLGDRHKKREGKEGGGGGEWNLKGKWEKECVSRSSLFPFFPTFFKACLAGNLIKLHPKLVCWIETYTVYLLKSNSLLFNQFPEQSIRIAHQLSVRTSFGNLSIV